MHHYHLINSQKKGHVQIPHMNLSNIKVQTNVSKWMGNDWSPLLKVSCDTGYNMIHLTPLQKRGMSNSPYSIFNHLELHDLSHDELETNISKMKSLGLKSMIDIVWNHIACNSLFLQEHPEIGYNLDNSPHLKSAYDLDEALMEFSKRERVVETLQDVDNLITDLVGFLNNVALWEYWIIDIEKTIENTLKLINTRTCCVTCNDLNDAILFDGLYKRYSYSLDITKLAYFYKEDIEAITTSPEQEVAIKEFRDNLKRDFDAINLSRYHIYDDKLSIILDNIKNRVIYERLSDHGPRLGPISSRNPIVSTYFTRIKNSAIDNINDNDDKNDNDNDVKNGKRKENNTNSQHCLINNGWIWDADPLDDFTSPSNEAYFLRKVIIWGDCVKLRYGEEVEHNPWLWKYMTEYTLRMASIFDAFRLDNCHSTPIHVARYLLKQARSIKPNLYVCAELFTGSSERDLLFVQELGIDTLIREAMVCNTTEELCNTVNYYSDSGSISYKPHALLMDCTHDNETPAQRRTVIDSLPNAAIVAFCNSAIGMIQMD